MHITAIYVFDNDADITNAALSLAAALFDRVICLDCSSIDGTRGLIEDFCSQNQKFELFAAPKDFRKAMPFAVNSLAKFVAKKAMTEWVFALAAMEFPKFENREHLEQILSRSNNTYLAMGVIFPIPSDYGEFSDFNFGQNFKWTGGLGETRVVACSSSRLRYSDCNSLRSAPLHPAEHASELYTFDVPLLPSLPIRSGSRLSFHVSERHWALNMFNGVNTFDIQKIDAREFADATVLNGLIINVLDRKCEFRPIELTHVALLPIQFPEVIGNSSRKYDALSHRETFGLPGGTFGTHSALDSPESSVRFDTMRCGWLPE